MKIPKVIQTVVLLFPLSLGCATEGLPPESSPAVPWAKVRQARAKAQDYLTEAILGSVEQIVDGGNGEIYILDRANHRICVLDYEGRWLRQIGSLGQEAGEFFLPNAFAIGPGRDLFVLDGNNWRLQILNGLGEQIGEFQASPKSPSLSISRSGEILLNYPSEGTLFSVYDRQGNRSRGFGALASEARAFPAFSSQNSGHVAYSRVLMNQDAGGNIYASYRYAPLVQKYDAQERLVWEHRLEGEVAAELIETAWQQPTTVRNENMDGKQLALVVRSAAYDQSLGLLYLLLNKETAACLYVVGGKAGNHVGDIAFDTEPGSSVQAIAVVNGSIAASTRRRVYRLEVEKDALLRFSQADSSPRVEASR